MLFTGEALAKGWLAVAQASSSDKTRPALYRTVSIEMFPEGVRLVATDSYVLLRAWVPAAHDEFALEPGLDEKPMATAVAIDDHGRARGFCGHVRALVNEAGEDGLPVDVRLHLGVTDSDPDNDTLELEGLEAKWVVLEIPDKERLKLGSYEGEYPTWRKVWVRFAPEWTTAVALDPEVLNRLSKVGRILRTSLRWVFGGTNKMARISFEPGDPAVDGVVMPVYWDFEQDRPLTDNGDDDDDGPFECGRCGEPAADSRAGLCPRCEEAEETGSDLA